jgi:hypothetical protein
MATYKYTAYDAYGKVISNMQADELAIDAQVATINGAAGYIIGDYNEQDYYWDGLAMVATGDMAPAVTAYQITPGDSVLIYNLPVQARLYVTPPVKVDQVNAYVVGPQDDGDLDFTSTIEGVYDIEVDAPKFRDTLLQIQVGSATIKIGDRVKVFMLSPAFYANQARQAVGAHAFSMATFTAAVRTPTNIRQADPTGFEMSLLDVNVQARSHIAVAALGFVMTSPVFETDGVDGIEIDLYSFALTTLAPNINDNEAIYVEDSMYVPLRTPEINLRQDDAEAVDLFEFEQAFYDAAVA